MLRASRCSAVLLALLVAVATGAGCGVAPVRWTGPAQRPDRHTYTGAHGQPLAYGGSVCAIETRHTHSYEPVPRASFEVDKAGDATDLRARYPFFGGHPHHGRTCFRTGWHLHLEPPERTLVHSDKHAAYTQPAGVGEIDAATETSLQPFGGKHPPLSCEPRPCTFDAAHGHRRCGPDRAP